MNSVPTWLALISALPGVLGLIGAAVGYGIMLQRVTQLERDMSKLEPVIANAASVGAVIEERTRAQGEALQRVEAKMEVINGDVLRYLMRGSRRPS